MTDDETKRVATSAAKEALQEFMLMLGVDISTPAGIIELQDDFRHVRHSRKTVEQTVGAVRSKVVDVLTGAVASGLLAAVTLYFTHKG